ncbi:hypothetical protein MYX64_03655 [Nitrospinae bacterium AH_259_B05_G02_I21]|nr:hypothetical protein [Nitrospinae bacterium AH_259_B05_G02_I21]MDA2932606.1 hypothetical protein [Nitrospinae bacterium AH-259-F20]
MAKAGKEQKESQDLTDVRFDYIKSQYFRVIHADGAIGGVTPSGFIHFALYNERPAIPRQITHLINPDGSLGELVTEKTVSRETVVREMDVDVVLSVPVAESLRKWLKEQIDNAKTVQAEIKKKSEGKS